MIWLLADNLISSVLTFLEQVTESFWFVLWLDTGRGNQFFHFTKDFSCLPTGPRHSLKGPEGIRDTYPPTPRHVPTAGIPPGFQGSQLIVCPLGLPKAVHSSAALNACNAPVCPAHSSGKPCARALPETKSLVTVNTGAGWCL